MSVIYHIIANLQSGSGKGKKVMLEAEDFLHKHDIPYQLYQTEYHGHATSLVQIVAPQVGEEDRLLVIGGDGTLHEVVAGLKMMESQLPIAYLPAGTGNDFARSIGLPKSLKKNLQQITAATVATSIECLLFHDQQANMGVGLNSLGVGFDGKVIEIMEQKPKKSGGRPKLKLDIGMYVSTLIDAFKKRQPLEVNVTVDGERKEFSNVLVAAVMNHPYFGGGIKIDPESSNNSHELAVMIIYNLSFIQLLRLLPKALTTGGHVHSPYFERYPGKVASIELETPSLGQVDGELLLEAKHHFDFQLSSFFMWK